MLDVHDLAAVGGAETQHSQAHPEVVEAVHPGRRVCAVRVGERPRGTAEHHIGTDGQQRAAPGVARIGLQHRLFDLRSGPVEVGLDGRLGGGQHRRLGPGEHRGLVTVGADDQGHLRQLPGARRVDGVTGQQFGAVGQPVGQRGRGGGALELDHARGVAQPALRQLLDRLDGHAEMSHEGLRALRTEFPVGDQRQRRTLRDRTVHQSPRGGAGQQRQHRGAAGGLAEHRHALRVAAERGNVVAHPPQRRDLVTQRQVVVEPLTEIAELESAEHPDPVGEVDHDHVAVGGQPRPVVELELPGAVDERATGDPHHHRQRRRGVGRPHRQRETRLVAHLGVVAPTADERLRLRRQRTVFAGVPDARPRLQRPRRLEPTRPDGLLGVRHAPPHPHAAFGVAPQITRWGAHDGGMSGDDRHATNRSVQS